MGVTDHLISAFWLNFVYVFWVILLSLFFVFLLAVWFKWVDFQKSNLDRETTSPFECGFDGKDTSRLPFSLRFFLIIILFIIFDVEICILLQLPFELVDRLFEKRFWYLLFVFLISIGVFEENRRGVLCWKI